MNLYWTITEKCQLKCKYCYYEVGICNRNKEDIDLELFKSRISEISKHIDSITFTGGEVLLLPYFWDLVEVTRACDVNVNILTDGIKFDETNLNKAMELGVSGVSISLDSINDEVNEYQRPLKRNPRSSISSIIKNNIIRVSNHKQNGLSLTVNQSITRLNIHSIRPMTDFAKKHGIRHLVHLAGIPKGADLKEMRMEDGSKEEQVSLKEQMAYWSRGNQGFKKYTRITFSFLNGAQNFKPTCPMIKSWVHVNPQGDVSACFYRPDLNFGNILKQNPNDIFEKLNLHKGIDTKCATLGCACMLDIDNANCGGCDD